MVIGGRAVDAISGRTFVSESPYTGQGWAMVPDTEMGPVANRPQANRPQYEKVLS